LRTQALRVRKTRVKLSAQAQLVVNFQKIKIMKKMFFIGIAAVVVVAIAAVNVNYALQGNNDLSALALANMEALADTECPDPYDVPNRYIVVQTQTVTTTTNAKGEVQWGSTVKTGYEKNKNVSIVVSTYNCDGTQSGACCKQSDVRVVIN
jgi:hypothetical protein